MSGLVRRTIARRDLPQLLAEANPNAPLEVRIHWLDGIMKWIRSSGSIPHEFDPSKGGIHDVRIRFILYLLDRNPEWKPKVAQTLQSLLIETSLLELFSRTGLTEESGFFSEIGHRLTSRLFPSAPNHKDFSEIFIVLFSHIDDAEWVEKLPQSTVESLIELVQFQATDLVALEKNLSDAMADARIILGAKLFSLSLTSEVRERLPLDRVAHSPFYKLVENLKEKDGETGEVIAERISDCRKQIKGVFTELEESGVSVTLVHRLEQQLTFLKRVETLTVFLSSKTRQPTLLKKFIANLIREHHDNRTIISLVKRNLYLLSRKIVERTGASGEHYISTTRREYFELWRSAIGGGVFTVFTAIFKVLITAKGFPLFFEGFFSGLNYVGSFLFIHFCHFTLATKQPSMTAAALAGKLLQPEDPKKADDFATEVSRIHRSQFISVVGNVGAVIPFCILLDVAWYLIWGKHAISEKSARYVIHSLHPFETMTILYGVITGVILWSSSIIAGWGENWVVYRRIPEAILEHRRLRQILGKRRAQVLSQWVLHNASGIFGNTSLGFLLAFAPIMGHFFGLPIDVRHITLSTGSLALAVSALFQSDLHWQSVAWAVGGLTMIGILNVGTAFILALLVAAEARKVHRATLIRLLKTVGKKFKEETSDFFWPSKFED